MQWGEEECFARIRIKLHLQSCAEVGTSVICFVQVTVFLSLSVDETLKCRKKERGN